MKKFFAIAIIAASLAACNNSSEGSKTSDTAAAAPDTNTMAPAPDTANKMAPDTATKMGADTTHKKDTSAKK